METLIRRHIMWRLIWVCTVCLCPSNGFLGKNGLKLLLFVLSSAIDRRYPGSRISSAPLRLEGTGLTTVQVKGNSLLFLSSHVVTFPEIDSHVNTNDLDNDYHVDDNQPSFTPPPLFLSDCSLPL